MAYLFQVISEITRQEVEESEAQEEERHLVEKSKESGGGEKR